MAITTVADVSAYTGVSYTTAQAARLEVLIPIAERYIRRRAGRIFYDATDPASDASQDWLTATSMVAERYLAAEDPDARAAALGPFKSERIGDYSYELKSKVDQSLDADPAIGELIAAYVVVILPGVVVNGPTRIAEPLLDPDVSRGLT